MSNDLRWRKRIIHWGHGKLTKTFINSKLHRIMASTAAKSLLSCPTLCDPIDGSPPGSPVPGILQARTMEWVAISFSNAGKWKVKGKSFSCVPLFATPWTAAYQAPPPMGFSRQEYWSGLPLPSPMASTMLSENLFCYIKGLNLWFPLSNNLAKVWTNFIMVLFSFHLKLHMTKSEA